MRNLFVLLPKKTLLLIFGLIFLLLVLLYFLLFRQESTPTDQTTTRPTIAPQQQRGTEPPIKPSFRESPDFDGGSFNIVFDLPRGLVLPSTVEGVLVRRALDENYISRLLSTFGITGEPSVVKNTISWASGENSLLVDISSGYVLYGQSINEDQNQTNLTINEVEKKAVDFINRLNLVKVAPNTAKMSYFQGDGELTETSSYETADYVEFSYQQAFNNTPIYYQFATPASVSITTDKAGNVLRLQYFNIQPIEIVDSTRIDFEKVKSDVEQGNFVVAKIDDDTSPLPGQGTITIENAVVSYFDDKNSEKFFPIILLEGTLQPGSRDISLYYSIIGN